MTKLRIGLTVLVSTVWTVGYGVAWVQGKPGPQELTGLMVIVLGWAFAGEVKDVIRQRRNGNGGA